MAMTEIERIAYWKKKINKKLDDIYKLTVVAFREIKEDCEHIGADPHTLDPLVLEVGEVYNKLQAEVDKIQVKTN